ECEGLFGSLRPGEISVARGGREQQAAGRGPGSRGSRRHGRSRGGRHGRSHFGGRRGFVAGGHRGGGRRSDLTAHLTAAVGPEGRSSTCCPSREGWTASCTSWRRTHLRSSGRIRPGAKEPPCTAG